MSNSEVTGTNTSNAGTSNSTTPVSNSAPVAPNTNAPKNNVPKNNAPKNNALKNNSANSNTNASATDKTVESLQDELDKGTAALQEKISSGDCDAIHQELKKIIKTGNSIMTLINAGRSKESDFGDAKGKLQVATENIKVKCPPKTKNQTGGKRKTRKQKRKSRRRV
jgi:methylthioribose-1-phosphate isomerase